MKALILDVESTTHAEGDPFSTKNKLCLVGLLDNEAKTSIYDIEYSPEPYGDKLKKIQEVVDGHDAIVGFNVKFDLHWLRRYGINYDNKKIVDLQLLWFLLNNQSSPYPSLNDVSASLECGSKLATIEQEYWSKGLDTTDVPIRLLEEYLAKDLELTYLVYSILIKRIEEQPKLYKLFRLQCEDLKVLAEMEYNGLLLDVEKCNEHSKKCEEELYKIDSEFSGIIRSDIINFNSGQHLSAVLYGGVAKVKEKETYLFQYKDGRTTPKVRNVVKEYKFPQLIKPLKGTALVKEGYFATSEDVLRQLNPTNKKSRRVVELILERAKLEKLNGTYYKGLPSKVEEKSWDNNLIHGHLNQVVARTGRLSSSDPNLQNVAEEVLECIITRYAYQP